MTTKIKNKEWTVSTSVDADGHLTVWISHTDGTDITQLDIDSFDDEWMERFTTEKIEEKHQSLEGTQTTNHTPINQ